jgi:hypothetical protein
VNQSCNGSVETSGKFQFFDRRDEELDGAVVPRLWRGDDDDVEGGVVANGYRNVRTFEVDRELAGLRQGYSRNLNR